MALQPAGLPPGPNLVCQGRQPTLLTILEKTKTQSYILSAKPKTKSNLCFFTTCLINTQNNPLLRVALAAPEVSEKPFCGKTHRGLCGELESTHVDLCLQQVPLHLLPDHWWSCFYLGSISRAEKTFLSTGHNCVHVWFCLFVLFSRTSEMPEHVLACTTDL